MVVTNVLLVVLLGLVDGPLERCAGAIDWWHAAEVPDSEARLGELVMSQGLVSWSREWIAAAIDEAPPLEVGLELAGASGRLLLWYVPAVEGQHMILAHLVDRYMMVGPLADPELAELVNRAYVPLKLPAGGELAREYGLEAPDVLEPALLVLSPDGDVVHRMDRINTFDAPWLMHLLQSLARQHRPASAGSASLHAAERAGAQDPHDPDAALDLARELVLEGRYERADEVLGSLRTDADLPRAARVDAGLLSATLARRQRRGAEALALLDDVAELADDAAAARLAVERGRVALGLGDFDAAEAAFRRVPDEAPRADEAGYHLGVVEYATHREDDAVATWQAVAATWPDSLWAARASVLARRGTDGLQGEGALTRSMADPRWMSPDVYRVAPDTRWRRTPEDVDDIAARAVGFLLLQQTARGCWEGARWGAAPEGYEPPERPDDATAPGDGTFDNIEMAISALCARALRSWRDTDPTRIEEALRRADTFLLRDHLVARGDVTAWAYADAYRLAYFLERVDDLEPPDEERVRAAMQAWIDALLDQQEQLGGSFRHYSYTSTFVTATVTACLHAARAAGLRVPDDVFERAADVLLASRDGEDGYFGYLVDHPQVNRTRAGAASRQPLCEWVLVLCGRRDPEALGPAVDVYLDGYAVADQARQTNFHVPLLDGHAGYFFFHNLYPACIAAVAASPRSASQVEQLLEHLCALPEIDGAFIDSGFSYGKSYGTAMALLSLHVLTRG